MNKIEFNYKSSDGKSDIHAVKWIPDGEAIGILQISHGVTEYILRYDYFAKYFTEKGFVVVGNDHLGHGDSIVKDSKPMYFGGVGSWNYVVEDVKNLKDIICKEYPSLPYFILGFSLGSFVVRTFLIDYPQKLSGVILVGTGQSSFIEVGLAKLIANREAKKFGEENTTAMIKQLTFDSYNKAFKPNRTDFDWLCSSEVNLDKYIQDPNRGNNLSVGLFRELLTGMGYSSNINNIKKMNLDTPILLVSGDNDPVGKYGRGVKKLYNVLEKVGVKDIKINLYPKLRHDILNEDIRDDIYEYLYNWLISRVEK